MKAIIVLSLVAAVAVAGCGDGGEPAGRDPVTVVAALYPLAHAAERAGGGRVEVRNLTPPGTEPHDAELSVRDVERVRAADIVLYLGGGFQPALERALRGRDGTTVDLLDGLDLLPGRDPHVWLDPRRYARIVQRIGDELGEPARAAAFARELRRLDREFAEGLAGCERRQLVTSHAAFGYLAERYGLEQIPVAGLSPEAEPSPRALERTLARVRESGATTVYFETLASPRLARTVARGTGARTAVLDPLEGLTEESIARGQDYLSIMRQNLAALREGLGCRSR